MRRAMLVVGLLAGPLLAERPTVKAQDAQPPVVEAQGAPSPKTADPAPLPKEEIREIDVVYFQSQPDGKVSGGTSPAKIILKPNPSGEVRVAVYEEFSGG